MLPRRSDHSTARMQQRCIPPLLVDWLLRFGTRWPAGGGTERVALDHRGRRELEREIGAWAYLRLERKLDAFILVDASGALVTAGYRTVRTRRR